MEDLKQNPFFTIDSGDSLLVPTATLQIYEYISEKLRRPLDTNVKRASAASACPRKRWYQAKGHPGKPMAPRAHITFLYGDLTERVLLHFIREALVGPGRLYSEVDLGETIGSLNFQGIELKIYKQQTLTANLDGIEITAHGDGFGKRNLDGEWEYIEIKSSANFGFDAFKSGETPDYIKQAHAVMLTDKAKALGVKSTRFYYARKETSHLWDRVFLFDENIAKQIRDEYKAVETTEPPRPYGPVPETFRGKPTGRMVLKYPCSYCPHVDSCQPQHKLEFKSGRPVLVIDE